ncbi:class I adenylate-forming enzyme family protein [Cyanobium gracile]|uniref:Acyl-CoA synthetase (AMP-forming)/AMP-acid ligase II n=1 Tax=Cyanobium gracile (strain ATCC 27147 / PCC 6307) TaxID=292564 RepID=K9P8K6_CYAGP|nr:class I adenylate-forming enzyme family protein [Cyanobium gracile]AFY28884.1 acyl-CoA synthetase (AMP-forming)/AMP-acid ligase II [Cyanobium gracile PCC 6307]
MPYHGPPLAPLVDLTRLLEAGLGGDPAAPALQDLDHSLSWAELDRQAEQLARAYQRLGLQRGDRLASLIPNRVELVVHYLAGLRSGLVLTPLNYRYVPPEIDHALTVSGAAALVFHGERLADVQASAVAGQLPRGCHRIDDPSGFEPLLAAAPTAGDDPPWPVLAGDEPSFIYFTSGSTGRPKGVTHSRASFAAVLTSLIQASELRAGEEVLAGSSLAHIASSALVLAALAAGASAAIASRIDAATVETLLRRHRPSVLLMLPAALFELVRDARLLPTDLGSVRLCISGGDKVPHQLQEEFRRAAGFGIDECFGMSEIGYTTLAPPSGPNRIGSVGRLCPGFSASLRHEDGTEVAQGEQGRLWIQAPSMMVGYWDNPQATADTIQQGWLDSGDEMRVDADGFFWFCGRRKQIIVHDSSNICPQEVEEALSEHPAVDLVGVIGIQDPVHGENVRAYLTLRHDQPAPSEAELIAFARARVGYKAPEEICVLEELPLTPVGKTDRLALRRLATDGLHDG